MGCMMSSQYSDCMTLMCTKCSRPLIEHQLYHGMYQLGMLSQRLLQPGNTVQSGTQYPLFHRLVLEWMSWSSTNVRHCNSDMFV